MKEQLGGMTAREFRAWIIGEQNAGRMGPVHPDRAAQLDALCAAEEANSQDTDDRKAEA